MQENISKGGGYYLTEEVQSLLNEIPVAVIVIDNGKYIQCNEAAVRLFHARTPADLIGTTPIDHSPEYQPDGSKSSKDAESLIADALGGTTVRFDWLHRRIDGVLFNARITIKPITHENHTYLILTLINNTQQAKIIGEVLALAKEAAGGNLRARLNLEGYTGDLAHLSSAINQMLDSILHPFRDVNRCLYQIEKGNVDVSITTPFKGEHEHLRTVVNSLATNLKNLEAEISRVTTAAKEGQLRERGNPDLFKGAYAEIIEGMNGMLNAVLGPIREGNRILQKIKGGDLREKMEIECKGDHANIKNAINAVHDWLQDLITYVTKIADGDMSADMKRASENDHLYEPLIRMRDNIRKLIADVDLIAKAGASGELSVRVDSTTHQGDYRKIVEGMNNTLDSVIIPIQEAMRVSEKYATYNFSDRIDTAKPFNGEWASFRDSLDKVGKHVSDVVELINSQVITLNKATEIATAGVRDISEGAGRLANNAQIVSNQAENGGTGIRDVLQAMEGLAVTVSEVSTRADEVNHLAGDANDLSRKGSALAKDAERGMGEITKSTAEIGELVGEITSEMDQISKITRVISDLANQTNLLALNAAIEAARAGEMGRGFAVVAAEVKSLAQESRESAENITNMISSLQQKSQKASETMNKSSLIVQDGNRAMTDTLTAFGEITAAIDTISTRMNEVASATEQQAASVEEITASVHEVSQMVQMTARQSMDAAAASEETAAAIDQVAEVISEVNEVAGRLNQEMNRFEN